jgi:hypothetical integral membrane protein (TIGR02206 family)
MIGDYFGYKIIGESFQLFSASHLVMIFSFIFSAFILFICREFINRRDIIRFTLAGFLLISELSLYVWYVFTGVWNPIDSLPLQLCSISLLLSIFMLLTRNYFLFEITYFLGVGGAIQAILTPELGYDFPHYRYFHFFIAHIAIILASFYMIWYEDVKPTIHSVWKAFGVLNIIALFVYFVNRITGGNYMFLARKPTNPSMLDYLGPYPWYIVSLEVVALGVFLLLYFPFAFKNKELSPN